MVPAAEQKLSLAVHPGDQMSGRVAVDGASVTILISDQSTGQSVTKALQMINPDTSSAEWIAEAPATQTAAGDQVLPLADFGSVTFTGASATAGGHSGSIADPGWTGQQIDLGGAGARQFLGGPDPAAGADVAQGATGGASAGSLSADGSSFTVSYSGDGAGAQTSTAGYPGGGDGYQYYGYPGGYDYAYPGYE